MYEYRIRAYVTEVYPPRSYKRRIFDSFEDAKAVIDEATEYYRSSQYMDRLNRVVIEKRMISSWMEAQDEQE